MNIDDIRLINFRNYKNLSIQLNKGINVFIGKNAQGKTNFLEAIYVCAIGKSFRTNSDREMINFDKDQAYIGSNINIDEFEKFIEIKLQRSRPKIIRVNRNELKTNKELNYFLNVVIFSPDDLSLVKDGPYIRRNFLDNEISQIKPVYKYNIDRFEKVLYQRNNLLKSNKTYKEKKDLLDIFDLQLAKSASYVMKERDKYIRDLSKIANKVHRKVTGGLEDLVLGYETSLDLSGDLDEIYDAYLDLLGRNQARDIEARSTGLGPHRDDMWVSVNGKDLRIYGSQGQQRTSVLSIKLAEVELIKLEKGSYPILLLDDVFSELDRDRRRFLIQSLKDIQTIITVTDTMNLKEMEEVDKSIFYVADGSLRKVVE